MTKQFDVAEYLDRPEDVAAYLDAMMEDGDPALTLAALLDVVRANGFKQVAEAAGVNRESLYRTLRQGGNPRIRTIDGVLRQCGMRLAVVPCEKDSTTAA